MNMNSFTIPPPRTANGYKLPQPDSVVGVGVTSLGDDKENYRWTYLTKNSEDKDDYSRVIAMTKQFDNRGTAFDATVNDVLDVNQWLRALPIPAPAGRGTRSSRTRITTASFTPAPPTGPSPSAAPPGRRAARAPP